MILIADGGSTKADWIALDEHKEEAFRVRTLGLNPAVVSEEELHNRIINMFQLIQVKNEVYLKLESKLSLSILEFQIQISISLITLPVMQLMLTIRYQKNISQNPAWC